MKKLIVLLLLFAGPATTPCSAQSTRDLIQQLLLDVQKLSELRTILQDMKKGYEILDQGYTEIRELARGRFNLHKVFLDALLAVSPSVRNYHRVSAILDDEYDLMMECRQARQEAYTGGLFTTRELEYFDEMYNAVYKRSLLSLDELTMVVTDGELRMSDAQRLRSIDRVFTAISGQLRAVRQLRQTASLQMAQRRHEKNELNFLRSMYANP
ncbi:MAG: TerB family tellurite resistance protein [Chitinophagaceae bacterium]|nr:TerB family tellurite resistance protein [Chitinophagaceae bacterium]